MMYFLRLQFIWGTCLMHGPFTYFTHREDEWKICKVCYADLMRGKLEAIETGDQGRYNMLRFYK
jgi:hypothetical protein